MKGGSTAALRFGFHRRHGPRERVLHDRKANSETTTLRAACDAIRARGGSLIAPTGACASGLGCPAPPFASADASTACRRRFDRHHRPYRQLRIGHLQSRPFGTPRERGAQRARETRFAGGKYHDRGRGRRRAHGQDRGRRERTAEPARDDRSRIGTLSRLRVIRPRISTIPTTGSRNAIARRGSAFTIC